MAYPKRDWANTGNEVTKEDFKRIENGIEANDIEITKQKNPTIPGTLAKQIADNVTAIEENANKINVLNIDRGYLNTKGIGDANLATENGIYLLDVNGANSPNSQWAFTIQTIKQTGYGNRTQIAIAYYPTATPFMYMRISVNDAWGSWKEIATVDKSFTYKNVISNDLTGALNGVYLTNGTGTTNLPTNWSSTGRKTLASFSVGNEEQYDLQLLSDYYSKRLAFRLGSKNAWQEIATTTSIRNLTLLNGWTSKYAKCVKLGNTVFIHISCYGGTSGTVICNLPYTPITDFSLDAYYRSSTSYPKTPCNIGARTNKTIRFSATSQPSYNGKDLLEIYGFYFTND